MVTHSLKGFMVAMLTAVIPLAWATSAAALLGGCVRIEAVDSCQALAGNPYTGYVLTADVVCAGSCFTVEKTKLTLDLNDHSTTGLAPSSGMPERDRPHTRG